MHDSQTSVKRRIAAGVTAFVMLVIMLFSAFYIAAEADHDCAGEDCPVCACIQQCETRMRVFGEGAGVQLSAVIPVLFVLLISSFLSAASFAADTLVSQKVRLNH